MEEAIKSGLRCETFSVRGLTIIMSEANVLMATRRFRYMADGKTKDGEVVDPDIEILKIMIYPNLRAAMVSVVDSNGVAVNPTFEWFVDQPEEVWDAVTFSAQRLNPTWFGDARPVDPKALTPSTSG